MANKKNEDKKENGEKVLSHAVDLFKQEDPKRRVYLYGPPKPEPDKKPKFKFPWQKEPKK